MSETTAAPLLQTHGLCRNFGGLAAVREVSVSLAHGELHAVIGPNGAGKSTLVNLLSGEIAVSRGRVELAGHDVTSLPAHRRVRAGIARSFQRTNVLRELSALENVRLAAQAADATPWAMLAPAESRRDLIADAEVALERAGIAAAGRRLAGVLSHGEQRQLEIAMTLATRPKVLLLDEPLAGMGQEEGERMVALLKSLAREHAVLLIEHDMDFVFRVADRMTVLVEGAVLATGAPAEVRANRAVQVAYLGEHG